MHFWKKNRHFLFISFAILPLLLLDRPAILWMQDINKWSMTFKLFIKTVDPVTKILSHGTTLIAGSLLVCLLARYFNERKLYLASRSLLIGLISSGIIVQVLKHLIGRARPRITYENVFIGPSIKSGYDSFPSGHTTLAFCLAFILSEYYPRYKFVYYTFAFMTCLHRLEGPSHFPTDILAGALLGIIIGKVFNGAHTHEEDLNPQTT